MKSGEVVLRVLNPRGKIPEVTGRLTSHRLADLSGKKIGVLNNVKSGGETLWPYLEEVLKRRIPNIQLRTWQVPFPLPAELKEPRLKEIAEYSDGVIALIGD